MIGTSLQEYVFIRISILVLRLVAPSSIAYLCVSWYTHDWLCSRWLGYYALSEVIFYFGVYLPRSRLLQLVGPLPLSVSNAEARLGIACQPAKHPTPLSRAEREALFAKCFNSVRDTDLATGWFHFSPSHSIRRDNVIEWILWALFASPHDTILQDWEEELEGYVRVIERLLGRNLEDGLNDKINCMKVTLDPVVSVHRPLLWYIVSVASSN